MDAAASGDYIDLQEYAEAVMGYIIKCIVDVMG